VGVRIADLQLPIVDWRGAIRLMSNRQSQIGNPVTHPLPRGGTDLTAWCGDDQAVDPKNSALETS